VNAAAVQLFEPSARSAACSVAAVHALGDSTPTRVSTAGVAEPSPSAPIITTVAFVSIMSIAYVISAAVVQFTPPSEKCSMSCPTNEPAAIAPLTFATIGLSPLFSYASLILMLMFIYLLKPFLNIMVN
jgi:hypothetical protein